MSRNGSVDLELNGVKRRFRLAIGELEALQEGTGLGPAAHLHLLYASEKASFAHVRQIILCGLVGGGMDVTRAHRLAGGLDDGPAVAAIALATLVLAAALEGADDEQLPQRASDDRPSLPDGKIAFAEFYGAAAAMKLPVADMRAMSLWQFGAYVAGHNRAADPDGAEALTAGEADALWAMLEAEPTEAAPA